MAFLLFLALLAIVVLFARSTADRARVARLEARVGELADARLTPPARAHEETRLDEPRWDEAKAQSSGERGTEGVDDRPQVPAPEPSGPRQPSRLERLLAEHALSIVGGIFVLVAATLFVGFAIDQGWIGPRMKFALALALGAALVGAALRVAGRLEPTARTGRAIGSLHGVLAGTGIGVVFLAIAAAVRLQGLVSPTAGVVLEVLAAGLAVQLARAWRSQDLAAFGIGVALAAPAIVGAAATGGTVALLSVTLVGAVVLAALERWPRLLLAATLITWPQLAAYVDGLDAAATGTGLAVAAAWWSLLVAGCVATTLRSDDGGSRSVVSTIFVAAAAAMHLLVGAFDGAIDGPDPGGVNWSLAALAVAHVAVAAALVLGAPGRSRVLVVALLGAGSVAAATAVGNSGVEGAPVAGWAAESVALAAVWWLVRSRIAAAFALAYAAMAVVRTVVVEAPPEVLWAADRPLAQVLGGVGALLVACLVARWLRLRLRATTELDGVTGRVLDASAAFLGWYAIAATLARLGVGDLPVALTPDLDTCLALAAWAATGAVAATATAMRSRRAEFAVLAAFAVLVEAAFTVATDDFDERATSLFALTALAAIGIVAARRGAAPFAGWASLATAEVALVVLAVLGRVPPSNLHRYAAGAASEVAAHLLVLVGCTAALGWVCVRHRDAPRDVARWALASAALAALYAVSITVVATFTELQGRVEQGAQVALTLTWVALGVATLFVGTSRQLRHLRELRVGAYALLGVAAVKLVIADTAQLETPYRVLAFLATGLALLGSAALEQRMRDLDAGPGPSD